MTVDNIFVRKLKILCKLLAWEIVLQFIYSRLSLAIINPYPSLVTGIKTTSLLTFAKHESKIQDEKIVTVSDKSHRIRIFSYVLYIFFFIKEQAYSRTNSESILENNSHKKAATELAQSYDICVCRSRQKSVIKDIKIEWPFVLWSYPKKRSTNGRIEYSTKSSEKSSIEGDMEAS